MSVNVGQTLSNIVGWCWTVFDQCWMLECSNEPNTSKQLILPIDKFYTVVRRICKLTFRTAVLRRSERYIKRWLYSDEKDQKNVEFRYHHHVSEIKNVGRCWMKGLNKVKLHPTSSNMFNSAVQRGLTCCAQQCWIMFDQLV